MLICTDIFVEVDDFDLFQMHPDQGCENQTGPTDSTGNQTCIRSESNPKLARARTRKPAVQELNRFDFFF
jgi:hypothetical protein